MSLVYRPNHRAANGNGMVPRELAGEPIVARSRLPGPMVISDYLEVKSMADGKMYDSKSRLRRSYRELGYVEVGNEWLKNEPKQPKKKSNKAAIKDSVGRAFNRAGISL